MFGRDKDKDVTAYDVSEAETTALTVKREYDDSPAGRLDRVEPTLADVVRILKQFDESPPALPDADALKLRIQALEGRLETVERRTNAHDGFGDALSQVVHRMAIVEQTSGVTVAVAPRDEAHEAAETEHTMRCGQCAVETTRVVKTATTFAQEAPCPVCTGVMTITAAKPVATA